MLAISVFLFLIPLSKHMHLVMAVPNVFFHDAGPMARMRPLATGDDGKAVPLEDLDIDSFGVSTYNQYSWRQLIDGWSCTSCARCQDVCPAYASGEGLNPMQVIHDVRNYANDHAPILLSGANQMKRCSRGLQRRRFGLVLHATLALTSVPCTLSMFQS